MHATGKIHKEGIWLPYELPENIILKYHFAYCDFFACRGKKKELFVAHRD